MKGSSPRRRAVPDARSRTGTVRRGGMARHAPLVLALMLVGTLLTPQLAKASSISFSDVTSSTAHHDEITWLADEGISTGWRLSNGTREYRPNASVKRGDMAAFLHRIDGSPEYDSWYASWVFSDVSSSTSHYEDIGWLYFTGISQGWTVNYAREYRPNANIKRGDMAAFLYRLAGSPDFDPSDADNSGLTFTDVSASTAHYKEIMWLAANGVSEGWRSSDGTREFRPNADIARGDMAAFLYRMADNDLIASFVDASLIDASGILDYYSGGLYSSQKAAAASTYGSGIISGDSASLAMVLKSLDFIDELNEIRDAYGVTQLSVSAKLMADQAIEADINDGYSYPGHSSISIGGSRCLAWGYNDPFGTPDDDSLVYWTGGWMGERKDYEEWQANGSVGTAPETGHYNCCVQAHPWQYIAGFGTSPQSAYGRYTHALAVASTASTSDDTICSTDEFWDLIVEYLNDDGATIYVY